MSSLLEQASVIITPNAYKAGKLYGLKGTDLDVVRATTATRVNAEGLIESVANNVPRLDYTGGSCPSVLVEPQRTNTFLYSEQFDNIYWDFFNVSVIANNSIAPNNLLTADKLLDDTSNSTHFIYKFVTLISDLTFSWFVKSAEYNRCCIENYSDGGRVIFDIDNKLIISTSGNFINAKIENYANGYKRISATLTNTIGNKAVGLGLINSLNQETFLGTGTSGIFVWGAQVEAGSYPTSYIPTVASAVTRNADVISKTGIADLIGQTEGTLYVDFVYNDKFGSDTNGAMPISIDDGSGNNHIYFYLDGDNNRALAQFVVGSALTCNIQGLVMNVGTRYKMAFTYKQNDFAFYINGILQGTDTSGNVAPLSNVRLCNFISANFIHDNLSVASLWKTRLTNEQLATLTTL